MDVTPPIPKRGEEKRQKVMRMEDDNMQRKVKIALVAGLLAVLLASVAYGAVLDFYGRYVVKADVHQSVLLDDLEGVPTIVDEFSGVPGGETFCFKHFLHNVASVQARVRFATSYDPPLDDAEIVTTYYLPLEFSDSVTTPAADGGSIPAEITVEEVDCSIKWTIDMDEVNGPFKNGHAGVGLIIGVGDKILYQVHFNDGTCAAFPWGTPLYSEYDSTGGGWNGWHTSEEAWSTPVSEIDDIDATGDRYLAEGDYDGDMPWGPVYHEGNPNLVFTITIAKRLLSCKEFKWAMALQGDTSNTYTPSAYQWSDLDTTNFHSAVVGEEIVEPLLLLPCKRVDFIICYSFRIDIKPGLYKITTEVQPVIEQPVVEK